MDTRDTKLDQFIEQISPDFIRQFEPHPEARRPQRPKDRLPGKNKGGEKAGAQRDGRTEEQKPRGSVAVVVNPATPAERLEARSLLGKIGTQFANNRKQSKSRAFESYQQDLANNADILVMGGAVTLKELTVLLMDLEAYMKSTVSEGESAAQRLQKFLSGQLSDEVE